MMCTVTLLALELRPVRTLPFDRYPVLPHAARITGDVRIRCMVDKHGAVTDVIVLSGHTLLAKAAAENARQWRFQQTEGDGVSEAFIKYSFRIVRPGTEGTGVETLKPYTRIDPSGRVVVVTAPEACIDFVPCGAQQSSSNK